MSMRPISLAAIVLACCAAACSDGDGASAPKRTIEELMDPETCQDCHPKHYEEWRSSMHAYAADDPVFLAMNRRGQRETDGELGDFCVNCHAPMAVLEGATTDGLNLEDEDFPQHLKGVTCYFCHQVVDVVEDHNNGLVIARDNVMRAGIRDPVENSAHEAEYSRFVATKTQEGAEMCGSCHDIVTPNGVALERTFREYRDSVFVDTNTCAGCHMPLVRNGLAAEDPDAPVVTRDIHEHLWPAVDLALTPFPHIEAQRAAINCELAFGTIIFSLEPTPEGVFTISLETSAGHRQPSGASQDRRLWLELIAYDEEDNVVFSSGAVADDEVVDKPEDHPDHDPNLVLYRDRIYNEEGEEVHMFWEAAPSPDYPNGYESNGLPAGTGMPGDHTRQATYRVPTGLPARVTARLRMRPMGLDVLQDLVDSGDLDPAVMQAMPTFTLDGTVAEWRREDGFDTIFGPTEPSSHNCPKDYRCALDPEAPICE